MDLKFLRKCWSIQRQAPVEQVVVADFLVYECSNIFGLRLLKVCPLSGVGGGGLHGHT